MQHRVNIQRMKRNDEFLRALGKAVAARRRKLGISQEELADRSQLNRTYIGDIERGARNIAVLNLVRLAEGLETTPSELLGELEKGLGRGI